jgi:hypothetical protein
MAAVTECSIIVHTDDTTQTFVFKWPASASDKTKTRMATAALLSRFPRPVCDHALDLVGMKTNVAVGAKSWKQRKNKKEFNLTHIEVCNIFDEDIKAAVDEKKWSEW